MSEIAKSVGQRIRNYRTQQGLSQEKLAELSGCHPTYIGQLERGEKNATLESIDKIATALNVSLSKLFEKLGGQEDGDKDIPLECYEFLSAKTKEEQEHLYYWLIYAMYHSGAIELARNEVQRAKSVLTSEEYATLVKYLSQDESLSYSRLIAA